MKHTTNGRIEKNKKIRRIIATFKYISINKGSDGVFTVSVPKKESTGSLTLYAETLRKAISIRNKVGVKVWGDYWGAVLSGYLDTIKSETASVRVSRSVDKRGGYAAWNVSFRQLENHKQISRTFSCIKHGEQKAKSLAYEYAALEAENRMNRLRNWNPRLIRTARNDKKNNAERKSRTGIK